MGRACGRDGPDRRRDRAPTGRGAVVNPVLALALVGPAVLAAVGLPAFALGRRRQRDRTAALERAVVDGARSPTGDTVDLQRLDALPPPVARYFRHVLRPGQRMIRSATIGQVGRLRTSTDSARWYGFDARMLAVPAATGFVWNARIALPVAGHVRVLDSYVDGIGAGQVSLLSAWPLAAEADSPALNAGALHRYLAEAVWFPTALLPQAGVVWTPIDARSARATLSDRGTTVALDFRFNDDNEVAGIYTPGRWGRFKDGYRQVPWEGRFRDYQDHGGIRLPRHGEVGWHLDGVLQRVWEGRVRAVDYDLER